LVNFEVGQITLHRSGSSDEISEMFGPEEEEIMRESGELRNVFPVPKITWLINLLSPEFYI
jgi:hypothetical protein